MARERLLTAEEAVDRYGLPSVRSLRTMRQKGLPGVRIGKAYLYDAADVERHIDNAKVTTSCQDQIEGLPSNGSKSAKPGMSSGTKLAANDHVRLAQASSEQLKRICSATSRTGKTASSPAVHAIRPQ
jgi:hypothetical protein